MQTLTVAVGAIAFIAILMVWPTTELRLGEYVRAMWAPVALSLTMAVLLGAARWGLAVRRT